MSKQSQRLNDIVSLLKGRQLGTIAQLSEELGVSDITVRRDLRRLTDDGLVTVVNGAVSLNYSSQTLRLGDKYYVSQQTQRRSAEKARIGAKAVELLEPNDTIIVDTGSTSYFFVRAIPHDLLITIICYTLNTFIELHDRENCTIFFAGGYYHRNSMTCDSPEGLAMVRRLRARKAFVAASGVHHTLGVTASNHNEQPIKQTALASGLTRVLLVDSSKFGVVETVYYADLEEFDIIVTDTEITKEYEDLIRNAGIALYKA